MRRVGEVVRVAGGMAIARSRDDSLPEIGDEVVDERLERVGRVVDLFGPIASPFVVIAPEDRQPATLLNERVYTR